MPSDCVSDRDKWFQLRAVLYPAPDSPGRWVARVLETDVVAEGDSVDAVLGMLDEVLGDLFHEQAERGLFPVPFRPAPQEVWNLIGSSEPVEDPLVFVTCVHAPSGRPMVYPLSCYLSQEPPAATIRD
jgi:hypothetical protein